MVTVSFDAADPARLAAFRRQALGYKEQEPPDGYASWEDWARAMKIPEETWSNDAALVDPEGLRPRLFFQRVPEPKTAKNRVHLDVNVSGGREVPRDQRPARIDAEVERLVQAGATKVQARLTGCRCWCASRRR